MCKVSIMLQPSTGNLKTRSLQFRDVFNTHSYILSACINLPIQAA